MVEAKIMKNSLIDFIEENSLCLHFDGKKLNNVEYQVFCLQSPNNQIKLGVAQCKDSTANSIFTGIKDILDEYKAWPSIKMIICDTTATNTGRLNGVIVQVQK